MNASRRLIVVGGGIAGLSAAHRLSELNEQNPDPFEVTLIEASPSVGGSISTLKTDDFLVEQGPDSFITLKPAALELCKRLGLADSIIDTRPDSRKTYVALDGRLLPLPDGFQLIAPTSIMPFLKSNIFSWRGKLRMMMEMFIPRSRGKNDESLASFITRRFGREALERVAQPMIGGIYTADPEKLSLLATMPRFLELERKHGSVLRALLTERKDSSIGSGARYGLFVSLKDGMQSLVDRLVEKIGEQNIKTGFKAIAVERSGEKWKVRFENESEEFCDGIILATPSYVSAGLIQGIDQELSDRLGQIEYASTAVAVFGFNRRDIKRDIDGFGFVVPVTEGRTIIAAAFSSKKFEGRASKDKVLIRCFVGGALNPGVLELDDEGIKNRALKDLTDFLGIEGPPIFSLIARWPSSMPQYHVGHVDLVSKIMNGLRSHRGLFVAGSAYEGVGIPDCVRSAEKAADKAAEELAAVLKS